MGDFQINYLHPFEKAKLDTILTPYNLNLLNSGDSNGTTNNSHSLNDYFIGDSFVGVIFCFKGNSCYKTDHKAVFSSILQQSIQQNQAYKEKQFMTRLTNQPEIEPQLQKHWSTVQKKTTRDLFLQLI